MFDKGWEKWGLQIAAISGYGLAPFPEMEGKLIFYRWVNNHVSMEFCWCCRFCEIGGGYCYLFPPPFGVVVGEIALGDILESRRLLNRDLSWAECLQFSSRDSIRFLFFVSISFRISIRNIWKFLCVSSNSYIFILFLLQFYACIHVLFKYILEFVLNF